MPGLPGRNFLFRSRKTFAIYSNVLVRATLLLKYEHKEPLGVWFANRLSEVVNREPEALAADVVFPDHSTGNASGGAGRIRPRC